MSSTELAAGNEKKYELGGKTLHLKPLPFGRLKKIMALFLEIATQLKSAAGQNTSEFVKTLSLVIGQRTNEIFLILFDKAEHDFINEQWLDDNMTGPLAKQIIEDAMVVNGMNDFLAKTATPKAPAALEERPVSEVPTAS